MFEGVIQLKSDWETRHANLITYPSRGKSYGRCSGNIGIHVQANLAQPSVFYRNHVF